MHFMTIFSIQGCGLTMITGFCTAINPIDFTLWTSIVLVFGIMLGICISGLCSTLLAWREEENFIRKRQLQVFDKLEENGNRWPALLHRKTPEKEE